MLTKDHTKWNFEVLQDLIEGPLLNPKRMEEAIKVSRFIRRLLSFFHPFSHRFSDMEKDKAKIPAFYYLPFSTQPLSGKSSLGQAGVLTHVNPHSQPRRHPVLVYRRPTVEAINEEFCSTWSSKAYTFCRLFVWPKLWPSSMAHPRMIPSFRRFDSLAL